MMSFLESIKTCLLIKPAKVSGRATRSEYWWFQLFNNLVIIGLVILGILCDAVDNDNVFQFFLIVTFVFILLMSIPNLCVFVRRLHDSGLPSIFILCGIIPYIGGFILLWALLSPSDPDNEYGPAPVK